MQIDENWIIPEETTEESIESWSEDPRSIFTGKPDADQSVDVFIRTNIGRSNKNIDIEPKINPAGDFSTTEDIDTIINSLTALILTVKGTYIFDPEFGLGLHKYLFEPTDDETLSKIRSEIIESCRTYEPRAEVDVTIYYLMDNKGFRVDLEVLYNGQRKKKSVNIYESLLKTV